MVYVFRLIYKQVYYILKNYLQKKSQITLGTHLITSIAPSNKEKSEGQPTPRLHELIVTITNNNVRTGINFLKDFVFIFFLVLDMSGK